MKRYMKPSKQSLEGFSFSKLFVRLFIALCQMSMSLLDCEKLIKADLQNKSSLTFIEG